MMPDTQQILNEWKLVIFICSLIHSSTPPAHFESHHVLSCVPAAHRLVVRLKQALQEGTSWVFWEQRTDKQQRESEQASWGR